MSRRGFPTSDDVEQIGYVSVRTPRPVADESAVTLSTTMKALWPDARTLIPSSAFRPGKAFRLTAFGKATTDGTAGNYVFEAAIGTGDAPAGLAAGATVAATTGQTDVTWAASAILEIRTIGTSGTCRITGLWEPAVALVASTLQPYTIPNATPADITINTTLATNAFTFQIQRSGAGVYTATTTSILLEDLN